MKNCFNLLIALILSVLSVSAQSELLKPSSLVKDARRSHNQVSLNPFLISSERSGTPIPSEIETYSLLSLDRQAVKTLSKTKSPFISLTIPQSGRNNIVLDLVEVNPFSDDFILRAAPSMEIMHVDHGKHYRGIIRDQDKSVAAVSIYGDQIMGIISHPAATGNLVIGKLENSDQHILYQDDQIVEKRKASCSAKDDMKPYDDDELQGVHTGTRALTDCVRLYLEVDFDIYVNKGSSLTSVNNYIGGVFNQVSTLYANEQIKTVVSEVVVWTQASPYNSTNSGGMLDAFAAQRQGFNGDLGMLLSFKASGGIAWVDGFCRSNPDYSMSYSGIQSSYQNVPTYSWTVEVCAHEFGHLFGSQHTHACVWNGNNTAIDGCATPEGSCPNPGLPSSVTGGTIMSYCHLTSIGIKFSNGFGTQPGNIMRSRVTSASCLQPCAGGGGGGTQCTDNVLSMELRTDSYANETSWEIKNSAGTIVYTGGPYSSGNTLNVISLCLPAGCYTFTIRDLYSDGICCAFGSGSYLIKQGNTTLISGGQFGGSEIKSFCTAGSASSLSLGATTGTASAAASSVNVPVTSNVAWTTSSNSTTWCTVSPPNGSSNGTMVVTYAANTSTSPRTARITVSGSGISRTYDLTQSGGTAPPPSLTLSANTGTAPVSSGSVNVGVTSNISWSASSSASSWCTVPAGNITGNSTLTVTYGANTSISPRTATITVTGSDITRTYSLTQSGNAAALTLGASSGTASAGSGSVNVGVTSNITWSAESNAASWCTVPSGTVTGNNTLTVTYTDNASTTSRTARITVTGSGISRTYDLTQSGSTAPPPSLTLSASTGTASVSSGSVNVGVTSNISWSASSNASAWCTVPAGSITGNNTLTVTYGANTSTSPRTATITVSGSGITRTYSLTQSGATPSCTDGIQNGSETGVDCGGSCTPCGTCVNIVVQIRTDQYPAEVTWNIKNISGTTIQSSGNYAVANTLNTHSYCMPAGCYTLNLSDTYGDGILSPGYYSVMQGTTELVSNLPYTTTKTANFCLGSTSAPTCNDGIKNGTETGVDCGGGCSPCSSCNDGVKNGNETSVDCGGSCTACPTCSDGLKNGSETGVDCGGSCIPCTSCNDGVKNGNETSIDCGGSCLACPTCSDGVKNGTETGVDCGGTCAAQCGSCINVAVDIRTDQYPSEITWNIKNASGVTVASGGSYALSQTLNTHSYCLALGCYTFNISDAYGDGILSPGYFKVTQGTTELVTNTSYTSSKTINFCVGNTAAPSCTDGIKNGSETGIDCGGSCQACTTCGDGVKNGNETGVDCGGSCSPCTSCNDNVKNGNETGIDCGGSCLACPTCNDGIKNGTETGVDCGGTCGPCNTGSGTTMLSGNYFEVGMDGWVDGGGDCFRYLGTLSPEGSYSIRIRDNTDTESAMTSPVYNLSSFNAVTVEFKFRAAGMEAGEDFWLRYFNGASWSTVGTFISGASFNNNQLYTVTITLTGLLPSNAQFRFQCDASENDDEVYIDAVVIRGSGGVNLIQENIEIKEENNIVIKEWGNSVMSIFPNPANQWIELKLDDQISKLQVFNLAGQLMVLPAIQDNNILDITTLIPGIYFIRVETEENVFTQRLIKI